MKFLPLLLQAKINDKINAAPDKGYLIGVWIGNLLPFFILAGIAYYMYSQAKKRDQNK